MECGWIVFIFSLLMKLLPTRGIQLNECNSSGWIQVEEGSQNILLLTCSGLESTDSVVWSLNVTAIGSCQTGPGNCVNTFPIFKVERPVNEYSKLSLVRQATKELLDAKYISCRVPGKEDRKCNIDFIIRAKEIACNANFKPGIWSVTTACNISDFYSTQGSYICVWKEWINYTSTQIDSRFVNWEMNVSSSISSYNRATCEMNKPLPNVDGQYNYTMKFSPVTEDVNANFFANNTIYKPKYRPTMNCTNSTYVVEGNELVCMCDASDLGQPPGRLLLHWNTSVIYGNYSVRNVLQRFDRVTRQQNGNILRCALHWGTIYTGELNVTYTFNVAYPPQKPTITIKNQTYPFMEGKSGTIFCQIPNGTDRGNPPAQLTWQRHQRSDVDNELILSLHPLTIGDNGRTIQCFAVNKFTEVKNMAIETNFTIQVYYRPILSLNESQGAKCLNNSHPWLCIAEDGERINVNCFARSNPTPKNIVWQVFRPYLPDIGQGGNLLIESANHSIHTGIYVCNVTTEDLGGNDSRLPLSSIEELHIVVKYTSQKITMSVNNIPGNIYVQENDALTFDCHANGRPTPKLLLFKGNNLTQPIFEVRGGTLNVSAEESVLSYNLPSVRCDNTAIYICTASNDDGASSISAMVQVFVMCVPRFLPGSLQPNEITFRGEPVFATFDLIAYPKVTHIDILKLGSSTVNVFPVESTFISMCDVSMIPFKTVCRILINTATAYDAGSYKLTFINAIGQLNFTLQLHVNENSHLSGGSDIGAAAGAGITLAVVAVVVALVMVILWRHGWILPCSESNKKPHGKPERSDSSPFSNTDDRMEIDEKTTTLSEAEAYTGSTYDSLKVEDIAVASEYDTLKQHRKDTNCMASRV